jgi:ribosomal protein S12 methylthiotransferase accessory factor
LDRPERAPSSEPAALPRLRSLVSPYAGIVLDVFDVMRAPGEARLSTVGCSLANAEPLLGSPTVERTGGSHPDPAAALAAALGEAAERYSATHRPDDALVLASAAELGARAVDPSRFALFHRSQYAAAGFRYVPFTHDTRVHWVEGTSLADGRRAYLPAQLVFLRPPDGEPPIGVATTNGVACGATREEAVFAGLCEVVERDAFMVAWRNRLSLPLLEWASSAGLTAIDRRFFAPAGLRHSVVDLTPLSGIPAALGIVRDRGAAGARLGIGAGCAASVEEAWRKALAEAFSVHRWVGERAALGPIPSSADDVVTFDDHLLYYARPDRADQTAFLDASHTRRDVAEIPPLPGADAAARIRSAVELLGARRVSAYAVDVTAPDVAEAGLHVVRVVAPELCALDVAHASRFLGGRRLYRAPLDAGLLGRERTVEELNHDPHPFP